MATRQQRTDAIRQAQKDAGQAVRTGPVRVRIVWDGGISSPVARGLGQAERNRFRSLSSSDPGAWEVRDVTESAREGFVLGSPAQHQITVHKTGDAIIMLLGQAPRMADRPEWVPVPAAPRPPDTPVGVRIAWHAGMSSSPVARRLGKAEQEWFSSLAGPGPLMVPDVQYLDFTLCAQDGFVVDSPALPHIAVGKTDDAISVWLLPARPDFRPAEISPLYDMGPGSPVRNPGSGFGPTG